MERGKVIGIGLNKTGTKTLAAALGVLGYEKHVSCRRRLLAAFRQGELEPTFQLIEENDSFEDWPFPLMYRELHQRFGERARYVLTQRASSQIWLESLMRHSLRTPPDEHCRLLAYGYAYPHGVERHHLSFYERHNREVVEYFEAEHAKHLLLEVCWENGDGWEKLCAFLGKSVPDCAFPHENRGEAPIPAEVEAENRKRIFEQLRLLCQAP